MPIREFGLFWRREEVDWTPGSGKKNAFRLLGRHGANRPGLAVADFRDQRGIYVLYGNHGPHYVGLTRHQAIGKRLKDHTRDEHRRKWDRFSWFGFRPVLKRTGPGGLRALKDLAEMSTNDPHAVIGDMEALLIRAMGLNNKAQMKFADAREWTQIYLDQYEKFLTRVARKK